MCAVRELDLLSRVAPEKGEVRGGEPGRGVTEHVRSRAVTPGQACQPQSPGPSGQRSRGDGSCVLEARPAETDGEGTGAWRAGTQWAGCGVTWGLVKLEVTSPSEGADGDLPSSHRQEIHQRRLGSPAFEAHTAQGKIRKEPPGLLCHGAWGPLTERGGRRRGCPGRQQGERPPGCGGSG